MEEAGAKVASPVAIHQARAQRFCNPHPIVKKRSVPFYPSGYVTQNPPDNWNSKSWDWDSSRFIARPLPCEGNQVIRGPHVPLDLARNKEVQNSALNPSEHSQIGKDDENLLLKLGGGEQQAVSNGSHGGMNLMEETQPVSRPSKRVRSGSPGTANRPMCQVDDCKEDLSTAKDYHRRHKVCEVHSKAGKALVGKQMQRFCQQCSRFHPLAEFDDGKRSCRRRLAGHNRRRRKTQPEEATPQAPVPSGAPNDINCEVDVINLLAALTRPQGAPGMPSDALEIQSQPSKDKSEFEKRKSPEVHNAARLDTQKGSAAEFPSVVGEWSSTSCHPSPMEEVDCHVPETSPSLDLQLFSSSPEDNSSRKLPLNASYPSSNSSNPSQDISPTSSPPLVRDLFPMQTSRETMRSNHFSNSEDELARAKSTVSNGCSTSLCLFGGSIQPVENASIQSSPYQAGYTSSGNDHSPSSLNSEAQDRTGRIIFKLFDKDPSHLPGSLRTQIFNWLSNSPSEMESFIRPGCIVLSLYLSMPLYAWDHIEENLFYCVGSLVKGVDVSFWGNGRFLVCTERQMASHKDGKIRLYKTWKGFAMPELISVSPVAVISGEETSLVLRGRGLTAPGTKVHCTHADGYNIEEVRASSSQDAALDEINLSNFKIDGTRSNMLGRCFIEVENSFRGTTFPVIIADKTICDELRLLEPHINGNAHVESTGRSWSREEVVHFLDELGWLFQRKRNSTLFVVPDYRLNRFKFLLIFAVEHDFCALVKTLLDILLELNMGRKGLVTESIAMLWEIHPLNRAVRRRCRRMVDLLVHYSVIDPDDASEKYIFAPNLAGPGGLTPLHLAASATSSEDLIDALISDPMEIGLQSWNSALDVNGLSPYAYALMRNNHSYNDLVARKVAETRNGEVCVEIEKERKPLEVEVKNGRCSRCAVVGYRLQSKRYKGSKGLLQQPYIHSMLLVAAVCVCVCVFLRGHPYVGCVVPFAWENLDYGPR
ncbi:squamosa promoter-binding-like protein 14 isoform X2 [Salvia splendens]|uniref:squamosa promoter-binding-like protein 14 isoform X2 n=1 Tax=Salvia splendens TaxID=180675 RepID=UPI001C26B665|nr:squamosa promoter-binding-like protein 14 isoform X2 [Salvia splendens]